MSLTVKSNGVSVTPCPAGNHVARCVQVVELGTQTKTWQGQTREARQVLISWELPTETHVFREENGPEPFMRSKTYTASLHEKSGLRKDLESWRGRKFTDEELNGFDLKNILGKCCMLQIVHEEKNGNTYANIASVSSLPKGIVCPPQVNASISFEFETGDEAALANLPDFIQAKIRASAEYKTRQHPTGHTVVETDESMPF